MTWTSQRPGLQAQLSRLTDRSRLRRLKDTLLSNGAWQQVTRIEDLCPRARSPDACAGSVLTPHDIITNVQKRLGNRVWVRGGQCRCCGSFLDPSWNTQKPAAPPKPHGASRVCSCRSLCGMKLADPGFTEPRGLTATQSRPGLISSLPLCPRKQCGPWTCP